MLALCMDETCQDPEQEGPPVGREDGRGQTLVQSAAIVHLKVRIGRDPQQRQDGDLVRPRVRLSGSYTRAGAWAVSLPS